MNVAIILNKVLKKKGDVRRDLLPHEGYQHELEDNSYNDSYTEARAVEVVQKLLADFFHKIVTYRSTQPQLRCTATSLVRDRDYRKSYLIKYI